MGKQPAPPLVATWPQHPELPVFTFGQRVESARLMRGLSQSELARRSGCTPGMVNQIERGIKDKKTGKRVPVDGCDAALAFRLSDALQISARWMIWGTGPIGKWEPLDAEEKEILEAYRELPPALKESARQVLLTLRGSQPPPPRPSPNFPFPMATPPKR